MKQACLALVLTLSTSLAHAQIVPDPDRPGELNGRRWMVNLKSRATTREVVDLLNRGNIAEKAGDLKMAEALYRRVGVLWPRTPMAAYRLASLYDKMGREHDAWLQYRVALADYTPYASNHRDEPSLLARYGDLSEKFGDLGEARAAYGLAATLSGGQNSFCPPTVPRDGSYGAIKAAAHAAASVEYWDTGYESRALQELEVAVSADPSSWVVRYYRALRLNDSGRPKDAVREAALAERLASKAGKDIVRSMRRSFRIPDPQGNLLPMLPIKRNPKQIEIDMSGKSDPAKGPAGSSAP